MQLEHAVVLDLVVDDVDPVVGLGERLGPAQDLVELRATLLGDPSVAQLPQDDTLNRRIATETIEPKDPSPGKPPRQVTEESVFAGLPLLGDRRAYPHQ